MCNRTTVIKKKGEWGINLKSWGPYGNGLVAAKVCAYLKKNGKI